MIRDNAAQALVCAKTELSACGSPVSQAETDCAEIIAELHQLLEGYAPVWYTEQLHMRMEKALRATQGL